MRPAIKVYVTLVIAAAALLVVADVATLVVSRQPWSILLLAVLLVLCAAAEYLQFQVHSGWSTHAGTVPHLARAFVDGLGQDPHDTAIVEAVIALAKALNLSVTGEGIETAEQRSRLRLLGCDRGQGYHFARPLPTEALSRLLPQDSPRDALSRAA